MDGYPAGIYCNTIIMALVSGDVCEAINIREEIPSESFS